MFKDISEKELQAVEKIGKKKAKFLREIIEGKFGERGKEESDEGNGDEKEGTGMGERQKRKQEGRIKL